MSVERLEPFPDRRQELRAAIIGVTVVVLAAVIGLMWAKWLPYLGKVQSLADTRTWSGSPIFSSAGTAGAAPSISGAWQFALDYFTAVWKALVVAIVVAAGIDALVPRRWLLALLARRTTAGQALAAGAASMPSMMCTCCTAPVAVGLRRRGVPRAAAIAYWLGNPLLNPAVLVFLALVLPWPYVAVRAVLGLALVVGVSALLARLFDRGPVPAEDVLPDAATPQDLTLRDLPGRYLRSLLRFAVVLVPEYAVVVLGLGLVSATFSDFGGLAGRLGVLAVLVVAALAMLLVIPTGGEIPVIVAALAAGAGTGVAGVLLIALPALSLPSMVMVGRALGWRVTWACAAAVTVVALLGGGLLTALS